LYSVSSHVPGDGPQRALDFERDVDVLGLQRADLHAPAAAEQFH
jgi:hypothetical protein